MDWVDVETAIKSEVSSLWPATEFGMAGVELLYENEPIPDNGPYIQVDIEGIDAEIRVYGGTNKRLAVDYGMVFVHSFFPTGSGKQKTIRAVESVTKMLELRTLSSAIDFEGRNPPSPAYGKSGRDFLLTQDQPGANYYRSSASVGFLVRGRR